MLIAEAIAAVVALITPVRALPTAPRQPDRPAAATVPTVVGDHRTVELVNLGGSRTVALLARVGAELGAAVDAVEAFWGTGWSHHLVVVAAGSDRQFAAMAGGGVDAGSTARWSDVAAVAVADRVDPGRRLATGQRVVLAPGAATMSTAALRLVLTHELFHYAARADTALDAPRWLTEGVADFVARAADTPAGRPAPLLALPTDADLDTPGPRRALAYDQAWLFARFVAESYGPARLRELYLTACGPGHAGTPAAVRRVLGVDVPGVLTRWRQWPTAPG